jgi:hypothetical protein
MLRSLCEEQVDFGLADLDSILATLLTRYSIDDLSEQIKDLFCDSDSILSQSRWEKGLTELYAFFHFHRCGTLHSLGWPPGYGETPPFDFRVCVSSELVPCDAKPASGSAYFLVHNSVEKIVRCWRDSRGLSSAEIFLSYHGTLSQQTIGPALREGSALANFTAELSEYVEIPRLPLAFNLGGVAFKVTLAPTGSHHIGGGIQGSDALVASLIPTLEKHVAHKAKLASVESLTPFALVYVQLPGTGGSDVKAKHTLHKVVTEVSNSAASLGNNADSLWLGVVVLDLRAEITSPQVSCYLRTHATWPERFTPEDFARCSCGTLVLV